MTNRSLVTGVFQDHTTAEQAMQALRAAGFGQDQIMHSGRHEMQQGGGFFAGVKRFFTGEDTEMNSSEENVQQDLVGMGIPELQARSYEQQYEAGRTIVLVQAGDNANEARTAMQMNGALDVRIATSPMGRTASTTDTVRDTRSTSPTQAERDMRGAPMADAAGNIGNAQDPSLINRDRATRATPITGAAGNVGNVPDPSITNRDRDMRGSPMAGAAGNVSNRQDPSLTNRDRDVRDATRNPMQAETKDQQALRLREEQLQATKERVQTGEVTLRKEVVTEQKSIDVPVTHEEVYVERRDVTSGQIDTSPIGEGETIRIPVSGERVEVTKTPVVTGEVTAGKQAVQETQRVSDTVKREEARVEQTGDAPIHGTASDRFHPDQTTPEQQQPPLRRDDPLSGRDK